jgi:hypothetical protein
MQQDQGDIQKDSSAHSPPSPTLPRKRGREQTEFATPLIPLRTNMLYRRSTPHQSQMLSATTLIAVR